MGVRNRTPAPNQSKQGWRRGWRVFSPPNNSNIANKTTLSWINPKELIEEGTGLGEHETRCCNLCTYHLQCAGSEWKHRGDPGAALPAEVRLCGEQRRDRGAAQRGGHQEAAGQGCPGLPGFRRAQPDW